MFARGARESGATVVGISARLTTTMQSMKATLETLVDIGMREKVGVIIHGAPVSEGSAKEAGAARNPRNASRTVALVEKLVAK